MNKLFKCKHRIAKRMDIKHIMAKEAYIAIMKMRSLKEHRRNNLQKLNLYYILLSAIYSMFIMLLSSERLGVLILSDMSLNYLIPSIGKHGLEDYSSDNRVIAFRYFGCASRTVDAPW